MRDPDRIQKFTNRLANAWRCYPDLRFGQIISIFIMSEFSQRPENGDPFYVEDEKMIQMIEDFMMKLGGE